MYQSCVETAGGESQLTDLCIRECKTGGWLEYKFINSCQEINIF